MIDFYSIPLPPDPGLPKKPPRRGKPPLPPRQPKKQSEPPGAEKAAPPANPFMKTISLYSWNPDAETTRAIRKLTGESS